MRAVFRAMVVVLIGAIVAVAAIPLLVLRNLTSGGTGWGVCAGGIDGCSTSYFAGFELIAGLMLALLGLIVLLRIATRSLRFVEHQYDRHHAGAALEVPDPVAEGNGPASPSPDAAASPAGAVTGPHQTSQ